MNALFLDAIQQYGYPVLWLIVFIAATGIPISGTLLLFASGAFAALGDFNLLLLFPIALSAAVMGDSLCYYIGRRIGRVLLTWLGKQKHFRFLTPQTIERAQDSFRKRAGWTIFTTRFLLVAIGGPVNFVAGMEEYPYPHFLLWDISGQILGAIIPLGLGYLFAQSWEEIAGVFGAVSSLLLVFVIALFLAILLVRNIRQKKRVKQAEAATGDNVHAGPSSLDTLDGNINTSSASD